MEAFDNLVAHSRVNLSLHEARKLIADHRDSHFLRNVSEELVDKLLGGTLELVNAGVEVVQDRPDKVRNLIRRRPSVTSEYLQRMVSSAVDELIIISPYFVPQKQGVAFFSALAKTGVRVIIVTNSLASTNHASVHAVYARYRKPLLQQGIELYELRPRLEAMPMETKLTLHSKVATVDRKRLFVGSFNLDPRSLYINTEMAMAVSSTELSGDMATSILESLPETSYKLELSPKGKLQWHLRTAGVQEVITTEPQSGLWRRFRTKLMSLLPIEGQM